PPGCNKGELLFQQARDVGVQFRECLGRHVVSSNPAYAPAPCAIREFLLPHMEYWFEHDRLGCIIMVRVRMPEKLRILACHGMHARGVIPHSSSGSTSSAQRTLRPAAWSRRTCQARRKACSPGRERDCTVNCARSIPARRDMLAGTGS